MNSRRAAPACSECTAKSAAARRRSGRPSSRASQMAAARSRAASQATSASSHGLRTRVRPARPAGRCGLSAGEGCREGGLVEPA